MRVVAAGAVRRGNRQSARRGECNIVSIDCDAVSRSYIKGAIRGEIASARQTGASRQRLLASCAEYSRVGNIGAIQLADGNRSGRARLPQNLVNSASS